LNLPWKTFHFCHQENQIFAS